MLQAGLTTYRRNQTFAQILLGVRDHNAIGSLRVRVDMMRTANTIEDPARSQQFPY